MFNKIDPNDLMLPGSPSEAAFYQNVALVGTAFIAVAFFFFFWLAWKGSENTPRNKYIAVSGLVLVCILAGVAMGSPGGIVTFIWMLLGSAGGYWFGRRFYHRDHPEGSPTASSVAAMDTSETKSALAPGWLILIGVGAVLIGSFLAAEGIVGFIFAAAAGLIGWYFWRQHKSESK